MKSPVYNLTFDRVSRVFYFGSYKLHIDPLSLCYEKTLYYIWYKTTRTPSKNGHMNYSHLIHL